MCRRDAVAIPHEFGAPADSLVTLASTTCMPTPAFGKCTGLSRRRLRALWSSMMLREQTGCADNASEKHRRLLSNGVHERRA